MRLRINKTRLYLKQVNTETGKTTVIFVHGFPFSHKMWDEQLKVLPKKIRGIAYDIRGFGFSEVGDGNYNIDLFADDLLALIDNLKLEKVIVCGLSMGGYIALRAREKKPEKFSGLILADTRAEADTDEAKIKRFETMEKIKTKGLDAFAAEFVKNVFWEENLFNKSAEVKMIQEIIEDASPMAVCGTLMAMAARTDTTATLDEIKIPTLILVGENDKVTPPIAAQGMHEKIQGSELYVVPDAGHMSNLENTAFFNEKMLNFLTKL